ncbi:hypothetical protein LTR86_000133 [Recurvomyces mirabilis]|nr:hypothetical protein LTR86_000133 [Recurvomyces mirabilis]
MDHSGYCDDASQMQGIIMTTSTTTTSKPVPSTPQISIFSSLITHLPAPTHITHTQTQQTFTLSYPAHPPAPPRRPGPLTKRPAPGDRASSFDLDALKTSFIAGPGAAQAQQEEEHAFRHVKAYADANADQMKTMLAFSTIDLNIHDGQDQGQGPNQANASLTKEKVQDPFFHQPWSPEQAFQQLQSYVVACQTKSQQWSSIWAPAHFGEYARSAKGKTRLATFSQSIIFMSDSLISGHQVCGEGIWQNTKMLREMEDLVNETLSAVEKLVDLGTERGLLRPAVRPLRRMGVKVREMRDAAVRLERWREEQLDADIAAELERQNAEV